MQAISQNVITQGLHGASKAVDYAATPDNIIYAPEDGNIISYGQQGQPGSTNDAGLALRMQGGSGLHQFAHTERRLVEIGQLVRRGQPIAVMGHTGYTIPAGAAGSHCHWWILRDGAYFYPPSLINEGFIKNTKGGNEVFNNDQEVKEAYLMLRGNEGSPGERAGWIGQPKQAFFRVALVEANGYRQQLADIRNALANEQAKPPKEVVKEVTKIVEKPVEVIKEVPVYTHDQETKNMITSIYNYFVGQFKTFQKYIKKG